MTMFAGMDIDPWFACGSQGEPMTQRLRPATKNSEGLLREQTAVTAELVKALKALLVSIENVDFASIEDVYDQIPWQQAEAAIAKATDGLLARV